MMRSLAIAVLLFAGPAQAGRRLRAEPVVQLALPPANAPFVFGPGDKLVLKVYRHEDLDSEVVIAPDGTITLPLLGRITVAGKDYSALVSELEAGLRAYYTDASVAVNVVEVSNQKVFVLGEVNMPSVMQITGEMTVMEALTRAGGMTQGARSRNVLLVRGELDAPELYGVDVKRLLAGDLRQNVALQRGDILVVPTRTITNLERFFNSVHSILGPFVSASQIYRNVTLSNGPNTRVVEDPAPGPQ